MAPLRQPADAIPAGAVLALIATTVSQWWPRQGGCKTKHWAPCGLGENCSSFVGQRWKGSPVPQMLVRVGAHVLMLGARPCASPCIEGPVRVARAVMGEAPSWVVKKSGQLPPTQGYSKALVHRCPGQSPAAGATGPPMFNTPVGAELPARPSKPWAPAWLSVVTRRSTCAGAPAACAGPAGPPVGGGDRCHWRGYPASPSPPNACMVASSVMAILMARASS